MDDLSRYFRPNRIEDVVGQSHLCSPHAAFFKLLKNRNIPHSFFYGPPGTGKTTLAKIIAKEMDAPFYALDATSLKVEQFRKIFTTHKGTLIKPVIFVDEVHRLSRTQQEVLLIPMENNEAIIIGASTENPYFSLTSGIRSRSMLFEFKPLSSEDLEKLVKRVQEEIDFTIDEDAKTYLIGSSSGDSRALLNLLEFAIKVDTRITLENLKSLRPTMLKDGVSSDDTHYNLASAMIKSIRGSDIDAALYYLGRLIDGAENPEFIARRLVILASEDIGNANPNALGLATNTMLTVSKIGYPESRIILSQCVIYLASCPKSNSAYTAINATQSYIANEKRLEVPDHLKSPSPKGYLYPHDFGGWVKQPYTTEKVHFYNSSGIGYEKTLDEWIEKIKKL
ncbi:MAG: replication-associated recombination protein A [Epsilonproteobacteria bacterium]|nr:replication-associated recombination protein A [Campylobacterota bacterium]